MWRPFVGRLGRVFRSYNVHSTDMETQAALSNAAETRRASPCAVHSAVPRAIPCRFTRLRRGMRTKVVHHLLLWHSKQKYEHVPHSVGGLTDLKKKTFFGGDHSRHPPGQKGQGFNAWKSFFARAGQPCSANKEWLTGGWVGHLLRPTRSTYVEIR